METVDTDVFWSRVVDAPDCFGELQATDAAWHERAVVVWRVVGETLVQREGNDMLVAAWENNLGLAAADGAEPGARKVALLNHMCSEGLPVPAGLLESVLTRMLGEGRARVKHSGDTLTVSVALDTTESQLADVKTLLVRVLPRNLVTEMEWADGLPIEYTPLEYLESTGTQYIDTRLKANGAMNVVFSFALVSDSYTNYIFGANGRGDTTGKLEFSPRYGYSNASGVFRYGETVSYIGTACKFGVKENYEIVRTNVYRNGNKVSHSTTVPQQTFTSKFSILVFGSRNGNNSNVEPEGGKRIYNIAIADEGVPVVNYIPALDPTGAPCMYDLVTNKPFYNSGTGDFLYPGKETEATTYSLRNRMYAQLTEHGIRRLYRVPKGYNGSKEEYAVEHGFKLLVEMPMPEEGYWTPEWHEREDCIELEWVETEAPEEGLEP